MPRDPRWPTSFLTIRIFQLVLSTPLLGLSGWLSNIPDAAISFISIIYLSTTLYLFSTSSLAPIAVIILEPLFVLLWLSLTIIIAVGSELLWSYIPAAASRSCDESWGIDAGCVLAKVVFSGCILQLVFLVISLGIASWVIHKSRRRTPRLQHDPPTYHEARSAVPELQEDRCVQPEMEVSMNPYHSSMQIGGVHEVSGSVRGQGYGVPASLREMPASASVRGRGHEVPGSTRELPASVRGMPVGVRGYY